MKRGPKSTFKSFKEISNILQLPQSTVQSLFYRGLHKLKAKLPPQQMSIVIGTLHGVADEGEILKAGSAECQKDWVAKHAPW